MYIKIIDGGYIYPNEPEKGKLPDEVELVENPGEGLDILMNYMEEYQECPETFPAFDDVTGEEDIELKTSNYLTDKQIDMYNDMFIECDNWEYQHLKYLLDKC